MSVVTAGRTTCSTQYVGMIWGSGTVFQSSWTAGAVQLTVGQNIPGFDEATVDRELVLELTKDVAHSVARPAAQLAAFLVGLAAGKAGGGRDDVRAAAEKVAALANGYTAPDGE